MRILLYGQQERAGDPPGNPPGDLPAPLARLGPHGDLVLIELQGALEMDHVDPHGGQTIGTLHFPPGGEDTPVLQISHHRLEGTLVKLAKPLAVLEKRVQAAEMQDVADLAEDANDVPPSSPHAAADLSPLAPRSGVGASDPPSSPTPLKRAHLAPETPRRARSA
ncbi:hypothetical protein MSPP1_001346 [Malassezia sp. CBS 17886]|nr:hypothetical protein MSPP1_001346 [Malassezia sp. CBS 17886]